MKRFDFPFERALEYREARADQERIRLEQLHANRTRLEEERHAVASAIRAAATLPTSAPATSADELRILSSFVASLRARDVSLEAMHSDNAQHIARQTEKCVEADRDQELLTRVRNRRLEQWKYEVGRDIEQTATDLWLAGYARRSNLQRNKPHE